MTRSRRVCLASGLIAPVVFVGLILAAAGQYPGYTHLTQAISELSATNAPSPGLQTANFIVTGILIALFGCGLRPPSGSGGAWLLIATFGLGIVVQGVAPCDAGCDFVTTAGTVHNLVGLAGFLAAIAAVWMHGNGAPHGSYRRYSRLSAVAALGGLLLWIAVGKIAAVPAANGSLQRLFVGSILLWCFVTALRELRFHRRRPMQEDRAEGASPAGRTQAV